MIAIPRVSLSDIIRHQAEFPGLGFPLPQEATQGKAVAGAAQAEWRAAIAAIEQILPALPRPVAAAPVTGECWDREAAASEGTDMVSFADTVIISGPLPVLYEVPSGINAWVLTPQPLADLLNGHSLLLPAANQGAKLGLPPVLRALPLDSQIAQPLEQFCLMISPSFSVGVVLGQPVGGSSDMQYSFDPSVIAQLWQHLRSQMSKTATDQLDQLNQQISQILSAPDYRLVTRFTQALLAHLPHRLGDSRASSPRDSPEVQSIGGSSQPAPASVSLGEPLLKASDTTQDLSRVRPVQDLPGDDLPEDNGAKRPQDIELLQAMAHEIQTPLTTIRTLTRSLMRRKELSPDVQKRLARIDQECTQQIDRFNLIFRAVELETAPAQRQSSLTPIALSHVFQDTIPRWQQQAHRRDLSLDVTLPPDLPRITSDPALLNQVLTGVVEWFTQGLPAQSHIQTRVTLAGHQLKLQFEAESDTKSGTNQLPCGLDRKPLKSLGQVLMVAPETGGLSLNLDVTKNLFQFLGGKLTVRQRPQQGDVLTLFLPLETREV